MKRVYQIFFFGTMLVPFIFFNQGNNNIFFLYLFCLISSVFLSKNNFYNLFFYIVIAINVIILAYFSIGISEDIGQKVFRIKGQDLYGVLFFGSLAFLILYSFPVYKYLNQFRNTKFEYYYLLFMIISTILVKILFIYNIRIPNRLL